MQKIKYFSYKPSDGLKACDVCYGDDIKSLSFYLKSKIKHYKSPIYIVDKNLPKEFIKIVEKITSFSAKNIIFIDPKQKTIDRVQQIWKKMVETVPDIAFIIGGGTVCDLGGFACSTYQRGIPRILFPTTVLSMVDASIGGKTGIDYGEIKNSIGAIHYPISTINYIPFLKKLAKNEYNSGFAEIIKAAVLYDKEFFKNLLKYEKEDKLESEDTLNIFLKSSLIKARVCEADTKKKASLLYGHSIGHAIERYTKTHLRHGDCVAIGMTIEGAMACILGLWKKEEWKKQQEIIKKFNLPTELPKYIDLEDLSKKMKLYKKLVNKDNYLFSLPIRIGEINNERGTYLTPVKKGEIIKILKKTLTWISSN